MKVGAIRIPIIHRAKKDVNRPEPKISDHFRAPETDAKQNEWKWAFRWKFARFFLCMFHSDDVTTQLSTKIAG